VDNEWAIAVKFWFKRVKEGYIFKFVIDCTESFNNAERKFVVIPRRRLLEKNTLWIKMVFIEKGLMFIDPDRMVDQTPPHGGGDGKNGGKEKRKEETMQNNIGSRVKLYGL